MIDSFESVYKETSETTLILQWNVTENSIKSDFWVIKAPWFSRWPAAARMQKKKASVNRLLPAAHTPTAVLIYSRAFSAVWEWLGILHVVKRLTCPQQSVLWNEEGQERLNSANISLKLVTNSFQTSTMNHLDDTQGVWATSTSFCQHLHTHTHTHTHSTDP